jgi:hypothetical protein
MSARGTAEAHRRQLDAIAGQPLMSGDDLVAVNDISLLDELGRIFQRMTGRTDSQGRPAARQRAFMYASISHWDFVEQPLPEIGCGTEPHAASSQASMAAIR